MNGYQVNCLFVNQSNSKVNMNSFNSLVVENDPR